MNNILYNIQLIEKIKFLIIPLILSIIIMILIQKLNREYHSYYFTDINSTIVYIIIPYLLISSLSNKLLIYLILIPIYFVVILDFFSNRIRIKNNTLEINNGILQKKITLNIYEIAKMDLFLSNRTADYVKYEMTITKNNFQEIKFSYFYGNFQKIINKILKINKNIKVNNKYIFLWSLVRRIILIIINIILLYIVLLKVFDFIYKKFF